MRNAMRFWDLPRGKGESCREFGDFPWKVRNADGTWDFLRGKYEMPCGNFDFLSRKDENPIRLCNLEFSRSKIALPCVPNRCAISGIRRRGRYIWSKRKFSSQKSASPAGAFAAGALRGETANRTSGGQQAFRIIRIRKAKSRLPFGILRLTRAT